MADKKEYIERGALLKKLFPYDVVDKKDYAINAKSVNDTVENAPAADVVEVRYGEWIESTHWGEWYYDCPFCDCGFSTRGRCDTPPKFCSNCGAKLTGERKEQNGV